jgi:hypothetical protein
VGDGVFTRVVVKGVRAHEQTGLGEGIGQYVDQPGAVGVVVDAQTPRAVGAIGAIAHTHQCRGGVARVAVARRQDVVAQRLLSLRQPGAVGTSLRRGPGGA